MLQKLLAYRNATEADVAQLKQLGLKSYLSYASLLSPENVEQLTNNLNNDDTWQKIVAIAKCYVCTVDNEIAGMAFLVPSGNAWEMFRDEWAYIRLVAVAPVHQGKGIAKELTRMCIAQAITSNEKTIALHTSEIMPAARHIYEQFGFKRQHELPARLGVKYWLYLLDLKP